MAIFSYCDEINRVADREVIEERSIGRYVVWLNAIFLLKEGRFFFSHAQFS